MRAQAKGFQTDLFEGNQIENYLAHCLIKTGKWPFVSVINAKCRFCWFDVISVDMQGEIFTWEVKYQKKAFFEIYRNNVWIEKSFRCSPSGIDVTKATFYAYYFENDWWLCHSRYLREFIWAEQHRLDVRKCGDDNAAEAYLIPLDDFKNLFSKGLTLPGIMQ